MKVLSGLKDVIRGNKHAVQGGRLYAGLMIHLTRANKPRWMFKIDQQLKQRIKMSISLPNNKQEKWARYRMLVQQGSMDYITAVREYIRYCSWLGD